MQLLLKYILLFALAFTCMAEPVFAQRKKQKTQKKATPKKQVKKRKTAAKKKPVSKKPNTVIIKENREDPTEANATNTSQKEVIITSAFKPLLRNAAKINFTAATPYLDTSKQPVNYFIPSQNLFFSYQPVPIKPLALPYDTAIQYSNNGYIKFGYGNYASPLAEAAVSIGNGKKNMVQLFGKYYAFNGNLPFQNYRQSQIKATTIHQLANHHELNINASFSNTIQYRYGIGSTPPAAFTNNFLQQNYSAINTQFLLAKKQPNSKGLLYKPSLGIQYFSAAINNVANEIQLIAIAPFTKQFNKMYSLHFGAEAFITSLNNKQPTNNNTVNNNLYTFFTHVQFATPTFTINAGILPTWDNGSFALLPDINVSAKLATEKEWNIIAGWKGYFTQNTLQTLTTVNPFITAQNALTNTKHIEQYAGIKGLLGKHFTMQAKASLLKINNMPLFANELTANRSQNFLVLNETNLNVLRISGEVGYTIQEKLWLLSSITFNNFNKIESNAAAYGLLPVEVNATAKWKLIKDLLLKADVYFIDGNNYRNTTLQKGKLQPGFDVSTGAEFTAFPKFNIWLQFNNLFNNTYQRWNQYNVLGFQVQAGFVYSFK